MKTLHLSIIISVILTLMILSSNSIVFADKETTTAHGGLVGYRHAYFKSDHGIYSIWYKIINGSVIGTPLDLPAKALIFMINATSDGKIVVELPRSIIDSKNGSKDIPYYVAVDDIATLIGRPFTVQANEISYDKLRIVELSFTKTTKEIEIVGTYFIENYSSKTEIPAKTLSPLKQLQSGTKPQDIICKPTFQLIINHRTGEVACVRPSSLDRFVTNGWSAVRIDPKLLHLKIQVSGFYIPLTLEGHFLKGSLYSQTGPFSNATVSIFANGVPMGTTSTFPDGCLQFNNWDEEKFSPKIDEYVKQDRMQIEHSPKYILFSARYLGDKDHYPSSAQASSYLYLSAPPIAPTMYITEPQSLVENLTQGNTIQFQLGIKPILKQSEIENPNLVLQPTPCGLDYDIKPIGDGKITESSDGKFIITLKASSYVTPGKYFVKISNNLSQPGYPEQYLDDIGGFVLYVMEK